jgi:hypothetical protein
MTFASPHNFDAAKQIIYTKRVNPSMLIKLNGVQRKWAKMIGTHIDGINPRTKILSAANKFLGKTCGSIQNITNVIWGPQNKQYEYPIYQSWAFPKNIWIVSSASALREVIVPEMLTWFPKEIGGRQRFWKKQGHKDYPYQWWTDTGFQIWLKTYDEDPESFESTLLGLALLSEPPPKAIYDAIPARLSDGGIIMCEMTPLEGSGWLFEDLVDTGKAEIMYGDIWDGSIENDGRHTKEMIQIWIDGIRDPDEIQPRVHGKPNHYQGAIFKTFNENYHVVPARELDATEQIWFVIDPHGSKPPFAQWWAINQINELRCVLEFPKYEVDYGYEIVRDTKLTIEHFCQTFLEIEDTFGFKGRVVRRIIDPFFGAKRYADTEYTVRDKYARHGIKCLFPPEGKTRSIQIGHEEIKVCLHYDVTVPEQSVPRLTIEAHCMNTRRAFKRYSKVYPKKIPDHKDRQSDSFQLTEQWKHGIDTTRYFVVSNPTYIYMPGQSEKPKGWREEVLKKKENTYDYRAH